ncbi:aldolase-type TIM barrel family protein [Actinidia rufa]|uniref:Aldolase-type TIM barrel family protein n=1 Tax=Actinidia rufa TaxID=165716 RepID=A0A7J0DIB8_9ERIC|nr:aldolase-type TIM barrel family protein [Actinidia rufa]
MQLLAIQARAAGIIATIIALEEVVKAAQGSVLVFLDVEVSSGANVFKALTLGGHRVPLAYLGWSAPEGRGPPKCRLMRRWVGDEAYTSSQRVEGPRGSAYVAERLLLTPWIIDPCRIAFKI